MSEFNKGDKVLVNGSLTAEIDFYDESIGVLRYVLDANGQTNTVTADPTQVRLELLEAAVVEAPVVEPVEPAVVEEEEEEQE
jgi:hypothetical protein